MPNGFRIVELCAVAVVIARHSATIDRMPKNAMGSGLLIIRLEILSLYHDKIALANGKSVNKTQPALALNRQ